MTYNGGLSQSFTSAITGAGTFGAISAFTSTFTLPTSSIAMPDDTFAPYTPRYPTGIQVKFTAAFVSIDGISISCPYTATFALSSTSGTGTVTLGGGTVNYATTATGGTVTGG